MDLHSGTPFWPLRNGLLATYPSLDRNIDATVAILGGGVTGALVAHHLAEAGIDCVVLDRRDVATGSTAASTALLQYEIDVPLHRLARLVGEIPAVRAYRVCHEAIDKIADLVRGLGADQDFQRVESIQGASRSNHLPRLRREAEIRRRHGFDVELWDARRVREESSLPYPGALLSRQAAQIDAHRFTCSLLASASAKGARIFDRTHVTRRKCSPTRIELHTDAGHRIRARHLVVATGYETEPWLPVGLVKLNSTYALVTEPVERLPGWPGGRIVWETARPYIYLRRTGDGRVIIGGYDEPFRDPRRRDALLKTKTTALARRLRALFPDARPEVAYAWCGTFAETPDGLPFIGCRPDAPNVFFALGYGGNGITYSLVAAEMIRDLVAAGSTRDADLFRFDRPSVFSN
ncbi:MAG: FAD-dependent oxidoreductase [Burkholderiales bacterium]|nr:FAD-dependent oxidoreductase [Opitutaceae bacterium]